MNKYLLIESTYSGRTSYGIALTDHDDTLHIIQSITDLSSDRSIVERFVTSCNELLLDPVHLSDAADDFLANI